MLKGKQKKLNISANISELLYKEEEVLVIYKSKNPPDDTLEKAFDILFEQTIKMKCQESSLTS